jgi:hypothetical protein
MKKNVREHRPNSLRTSVGRKKKKKKSTKKVAGVGFEPGGSGSIPTFGTFSVDRFFLSYIYPFKKKVLPFGRTFCS